MSSASSSFAVPPRRPFGLMVVVLLVDLGLAAAGAVLLSKGLADDDAKAAPAPVENKSEAPAPTAAGGAAAAALAPPAAASAPIVSPPATPSAEPAPAPSTPPAMPAARKDNAKQRDDKTIGAAKSATTAKSTARTTAPTTRTSAATSNQTDGPVTQPREIPVDTPAEPRLVTSVPSEPQDPYQPPDTAREIDAVAARSRAAFERCEANFGPARGTIQIAFQVRGDGRVANAAAVENSTGNTDLANCLVTVVSSWRVSAHQGAAINMLRPFTYP